MIQEVRKRKVNPLWSGRRFWKMVMTWNRQKHYSSVPPLQDKEKREPLVLTETEPGNKEEREEGRHFTTFGSTELLKQALRRKGGVIIIASEAKILVLLNMLTGRISCSGTKKSSLLKQPLLRMIKGHKTSFERDPNDLWYFIQIIRLLWTAVW